VKLEGFVRKAIRAAAIVAGAPMLVAIAGCSGMPFAKKGGGPPPAVLTMTATSSLNNCGRAVPLVLHYRMLQLSDTQPLAGMKLDQLYDHESEMLGGALVWRGPDLVIEPGARKSEAPVPVVPGAKAIVVLANFCRTRGSCLTYVFDLANATGKEYKKHIALDLTADSTCIGPTPH